MSSSRTHPTGSDDISSQLFIANAITTAGLLTYNKASGLPEKMSVTIELTSSLK